MEIFFQLPKLIKSEGKNLNLMVVLIIIYIAFSVTLKNKRTRVGLDVFYKLNYFNSFFHLMKQKN